MSGNKLLTNYLTVNGCHKNNFKARNSKLKIKHSIFAFMRKIHQDRRQKTGDCRRVRMLSSDQSRIFILNLVDLNNPSPPFSLLVTWFLPMKLSTLTRLYDLKLHETAQQKTNWHTFLQKICQFKVRPVFSVYSFSQQWQVWCTTWKMICNLQ